MNLQDEIYRLLRKSPNMREVCRRYPELSDKELYEELLAQSKIDERVEIEPILKESVDGFLKNFNLKPSEILDITDDEDEIGIRMKFEEMKEESGINFGRKNFGTGKGANFKFEINSDSDAKGDFSVNPNDLSF